MGKSASRGTLRELEALHGRGATLQNRTTQMNAVPKIIEAQYLHDRVLRLRFLDGYTEDFDFEPMIHGKMSQALRDLDFFMQFRIVAGGLEWPNGYDVCPTPRWFVTIMARYPRRFTSRSVSTTSGKSSNSLQCRTYPPTMRALMTPSRSKKMALLGRVPGSGFRGPGFEERGSGEFLDFTNVNNTFGASSIYRGRSENVVYL